MMLDCMNSQFCIDHSAIGSSQLEQPDEGQLNEGRSNEFFCGDNQRELSVG